MTQVPFIEEEIFSFVLLVQKEPASNDPLMDGSALTVVTIWINALNTTWQEQAVDPLPSQTSAYALHK